MRRWLIEKLGGYPDIDSAIEAIKETKDYERRNKILTLAVRRLFSTIGPDDILHPNKEGEWVYKGKTLSNGVKDLLKAEAKSFLNSRLWDVLQSDVKHQANKKMYLQATDEEQLTAGKLWTYTLDAFRTRLTSMLSDSALFNAEAEKKVR